MSEKSPETLLKLSLNPFYKLTKAEQERLDDFLSQNTVRPSGISPRSKSTGRVKSTPATAEDSERVISKNLFAKETGEIIEEEPRG